MLDLFLEFYVRAFAVLLPAIAVAIMVSHAVRAGLPLNSAIGASLVSRFVCALVRGRIADGRNRAADAAADGSGPALYHDVPARRRGAALVVDAADRDRQADQRRSRSDSVDGLSDLPIVYAPPASAAWRERASAEHGFARSRSNCRSVTVQVRGTD